MLSAVLDGANDPAIDGVDVAVLDALEATSADLLAADAILLGTTANFGYISGALKHFFDITFRDAAEAKKGTPFSYWIRGGMDTTGAENAMKSITTGYGWELAAEPVVFVGELSEKRREALVNLGGTLAAGIMQ